MIHPESLRAISTTVLLTVSFILVVHYPADLHILCLKQTYLIPEMPVKQGMLFSEDENQMDVDEQKTNGLVAKAKITQFEVEINF